MSKRYKLKRRARYNRRNPIMVQFGLVNFRRPKLVKRILAKAFVYAWQKEMAKRILYGTTEAIRNG